MSLQSEHKKLTFSPMQRIVPTSDSERGDRSFPIVSVRDVGEPGSKTDDPLNAVTVTSFPARIAAPTSTFSSVG